MKTDDAIPFVKGFLAGRVIEASVHATWFPAGMHLHLVPISEYEVQSCDQALQDLLALHLTGWTGEVMPVGWRREVC